MLCTTCNKYLNRPPSLLKGKNNFCNHKCYSVFKSKKWEQENNPRWNGGENIITCLNCSNIFTRKKYGKIESKYCSVNCATNQRDINGEKHWNWKGGKDTRYMRKNAPRPMPNECEICKTPASYFKKGLQYDHDHKTGKFRGWLCLNCNTALGLVKDNTETLKSLIKYLEVNENLF